MAGKNDAASDRPPALEQDRGDEGGSNTREPSVSSASSAGRAHETGANTSRDVADAVECAFREAAAAHLEHVRRVLAATLTPELLEDVQRYAEQRAAKVRRTGRPCPRRLNDYARELLDDAYTDTWTGDLAWDPDACSLATHLRMAIKTRTCKEMEKAPRYVSIDANVENKNEDGTGPVPLVDTFASSGDLSSIQMAAYVAQVCKELAQASAGDLDCLAVLHAWQRGLVDREEILRLTGLTASAYKRARNRLMYAASDLPTELRQLVQDYLRSK